MYGGAANVILRKAPARFDVYNDVDEEVVLFFRVLRDRTDELLRAVELTPFSRAELDSAFLPADDPLERARRFYVRSWQARGGPRAQWKTGWRFQRTNNRGKRSLDDWNQTSRLQAAVDRLRQLYIECDRALTVIARYDTPDTLFYCDPPYLASTRSERWGTTAYSHEMTEADHIELAETLHAIEGMAVISGYASELYDDLYQDWHPVQYACRTDANQEVIECFWISPHASARQLPLLRMMEDSSRDR